MVWNVYLSSNKGMTLSNISCYFGPYHSKITQQHRHLNIEKWGILTLIYLDLKISWNFLFIFSKIKKDLIFKMQQTRHLQFYQYRNQKYPKSLKFDLKIANIPKWSIYTRFFLLLISDFHIRACWEPFWIVFGQIVQKINKILDFL